MRRLNYQPKIIITINSDFELLIISEAGKQSGKQIDILIKCDMGSTTGVKSPREVIYSRG